MYFLVGSEAVLVTLKPSTTQTRGKLTGIDNTANKIEVHIKAGLNGLIVMLGLGFRGLEFSVVVRVMR